MIDAFLKVEAFYKRLKHEHFKAQLLKTMRRSGSNFRIGEGFRWRGPEKAEIGNNCFFNRDAFINSSGGLKIGNSVIFGPFAVIWTVDHDPYGESLPFGEKRIYRPVTIGSNVWAGFGVTVVPGTTIGEGAIIGAGTVVSGMVPPLAIIAGEKWRQIGERDRTHYRRLSEK